MLILASLPPPLKNAESIECKRTRAEFQFIMAPGLFEVDSGKQRHEVEKILMIQCKITHYFLNAFAQDWHWYDINVQVE